MIHYIKQVSVYCKLLFWTFLNIESPANIFSHELLAVVCSVLLGETEKILKNCRGIIGADDVRVAQYFVPRFHIDLTF